MPRRFGILFWILKIDPISVLCDIWRLSSLILLEESSPSLWWFSHRSVLSSTQLYSDLQVTQHDSLEFFLHSFHAGSDGKESACSVGDLGSIPGSGRSPGEGNGNPLQCSCLENPMDGGAWWASVHGVAENRTRLSDSPFLFSGAQLGKLWPPWLRETTGLCLASLSLGCSLETSSRQWAWKIIFIIVFLSPWSLRFPACVQCLSYILSHVSAFSGNRVNLILITLS